MTENCLFSALNNLQQTVASCTQCALYKTRTQTVFARGNPLAKLMIIGEAPGFYEDKQGLPFVGKAGMLLNKMLATIGLDEQNVYITNVIKCRPPNNRDPKSEEIMECSHHLIQQIQTINPQLILAIGRFAGQFLLKQQCSMTNMRNTFHLYQNIPVIVSYHPAYLLRNPKDKKKAFQDLQRVNQRLMQYA